MSLTPSFARTRTLNVMNPQSPAVVSHTGCLYTQNNYIRLIFISYRGLRYCKIAIILLRKIDHFRFGIWFTVTACSNKPVNWKGVLVMKMMVEVTKVVAAEAGM